jgi:hypothetical protein
LTEDEQEFIDYLRRTIERAVPDTDAPMIVSPDRWATYLTWALDKVEAMA